MITLQDFNHYCPLWCLLSWPFIPCQLSFLKHKTDPDTVTLQILADLLNGHREFQECVVWHLIISSSSSLLPNPYLSPSASQPAPWGASTNPTSPSLLHSMEPLRFSVSPRLCWALLPSWICWWPPFLHSINSSYTSSSLLMQAYHLLGIRDYLIVPSNNSISFN